MVKLVKPAFWATPHKETRWADRIAPLALLPFSWLYSLGRCINEAIHHPYKADIPVICVGNGVAGGAGKTPCAIHIFKTVKQDGIFNNPVIVLKGYGGATTAPHIVDSKTDTAHDVGDEAVMIAARGIPVITAKDRKAGIRHAEASGFDAVIMDDGLQSPSITRDISFCVIDGGYGFGNGFCLPSGPLREPVSRILAKSDAVIVTTQTKDFPDTITHPLGNLPVFQAHYHIDQETAADPAKSYIAFSGIARPEKFYDSLHQAGYPLVDQINFPDHYMYTDADLLRLHETAKAQNAVLITTEKDAARLGAKALEKIDAETISIRLDLCPLSPEDGALSDVIKEGLKA